MNDRKDSPESSSAKQIDPESTLLENRLLKQQCASLEAEIRKMRASCSWRITEPLRILSRMMRRLGGEGRKGENSSLCRGNTLAADVPTNVPTEDSFVLYRIIGNDLYPRHRKGQTLDNLRFILEHEPELECCEKRFILNRILEPDQEQAAISLLAAKGYPWIRIGFDPDEYSKIGLDDEVLPWADFLSNEEYGLPDEAARGRFELALYRYKNNYAMNINGARNAALADGRQRAKWIMPWDGNCFLTEEAWRRIRFDMMKAPDRRYYVVPMARMQSNEPLVNGGEIPEATEEPQIMFRADARELFDTGFYYGHRDKVELLWRLGVVGKWSGYHDDPWDRARSGISRDAAFVGRAGWVARLFSGMPMLEKDTDLSALHRGQARTIAIMETLRRLDATLGNI